MYETEISNEVFEYITYSDFQKLLSGNVSDITIWTFTGKYE